MKIYHHFYIYYLRNHNITQFHVDFIKYFFLLV